MSAADKAKMHARRAKDAHQVEQKLNELALAISALAEAIDELKEARPQS